MKLAIDCIIIECNSVPYAILLYVQCVQLHW
jgi:hypothetical protein